jgi:homoserine trans-succinylase
MKARFITDEKGNKNFVVLTVKEYKKYLDKIEYLEDTIDALKVRKNQKFYDWEDVKKELMEEYKKSDEANATTK